MNRLKVLPLQGGFEDEQAFASRKLIYYPVLQDLDTGAFVAACAELLKRLKWFPVPQDIREEAAAWTSVDVKALSPSRLNPEELEAERGIRRQETARGLAMIREGLEQRGALPPGPGPGSHRMIDLTRDASGTFVELTEERRQELLKKARGV